MAKCTKKCEFNEVCVFSTAKKEKKNVCPVKNGPFVKVA